MISEVSSYEETG